MEKGTTYSLELSNTDIDIGLKDLVWHVSNS